MKYTITALRFALLLVFVALPQCNSRDVKTEKPIQQVIPKSSDYVLDTMITKQIPLTVDNEWATIYYHLKVKDWMKPVEWTFDVVKGNDTVYLVTPDSLDARRDTFFYDFGYVSQSPETSYIGQKMFWYLTRNVTYHSDTIEANSRAHKNEWKNYGKHFKADSVWAYYENRPMIVYSFFAASYFEEYPGAWVYYPKVKKLVEIYVP